MILSWLPLKNNNNKKKNTYTHTSLYNIPYIKTSIFLNTSFKYSFFIIFYSSSLYLLCVFLSQPSAAGHHIHPSQSPHPLTITTTSHQPNPPQSQTIAKKKKKKNPPQPKPPNQPRPRPTTSPSCTSLMRSTATPPSTHHILSLNHSCLP